MSETITVNGTVARKDLRETAQASGWTAEHGRISDIYRRDADTIEVVSLPPAPDGIAIRSGTTSGGVSIGLNGQPITSSTDQRFNVGQALEVMREDPHVRRLYAAMRADEDYDAPGEILATELDFADYNTSVVVRVGKFEDGFTVWWTDGVANDWTQWFPTMSTALAFVGALAYCGEHDWERWLPIDHRPGTVTRAFHDTAQAWYGEILD